MSREDRDHEREESERPRRPGGRERPAAVVETPGSLGGDHTDEPEEPEEPDHGHVVRERRGAEEECQRRPEHRERREGRRPRTIVHRSARSRRTVAPTEASSAGYFMRVFGARGGTARYTRTASTTPATAAVAKTTRQPAASAISPLRVRETRIPVKIPETTMPTTLPRVAISARSPASGARICPATVVTPTMEIANKRTPIDGATAHSVSAAAAQIIIAGTRCRRLRNITQRENQQDPRGVADLSRGDKPTGRRRRRSEVARDEVEERLRQVEIPDCDATRHSEQQRQRASHQPAWLNGCGPSPSVRLDALLCSLAPASLNLHRPAILFVRAAHSRTRSGGIPVRWRTRGLSLGRGTQPCRLWR